MEDDRSSSTSESECEQAAGTGTPPPMPVALRSVSRQVQSPFVRKFPTIRRTGSRRLQVNSWAGTSSFSGEAYEAPVAPPRRKRRAPLPPHFLASTMPQIPSVSELPPPPPPELPSATCEEPQITAAISEIPLPPSPTDEIQMPSPLSELPPPPSELLSANCEEPQNPAAISPVSLLPSPTDEIPLPPFPADEIPLPPSPTGEIELPWSPSELPPDSQSATCEEPQNPAASSEIPLLPSPTGKILLAPPPVPPLPPPMPPITYMEPQLPDPLLPAARTELCAEDVQKQQEHYVGSRTRNGDLQEEITNTLKKLKRVSVTD